MKIAQLALDDYANYGNFLQKYAMQRTLKKFSDDVTFFWSSSNTFWVETDFVPVPSPLIRNIDPAEYQRWLCRESVRVTKIKEFAERYIETRFNLPYVNEVADEYDFFVVGSDQVWGLYAQMFLPFFPREKKIAYAASIASPVIPDELKAEYREGILSFAHVSVREENAVKLISDLGLPPPLLVLDPVFLLTVEEWLRIARPPSWFKEKYSRGYIFTYYLRDVPPPEIKTLSQELNLPVINLLDMNNFNHYTVGPEEFLFLLANASLVCTNSFHGVAFSILFKRPFLNIEYVDELTEKMSMRIPSLLKIFELEDRTATVGNYKINSPLEIDFSFRDKILPKERAKSFGFLANALGATVSTKWGGGRLSNENRKHDFKKSRRLYRLRSLLECLSEKLYYYAPRRRRLCVSENSS